MAQFRERLRLDLADAFASHAELLADLFERADLAVVETEAQPHNRAFTIVQLLQCFLDRFADLELIYEQRLPYLQSSNLDTMYLLKKK